MSFFKLCIAASFLMECLEEPKPKQKAEPEPEDNFEPLEFEEPLYFERPISYEKPMPFVKKEDSKSKKKEWNFWKLFI